MENMENNPKNNATMIVFDGDLDKAIASFIIATGAAAMGKQVTMFFTFWGLNVLRKDEAINVKNKNFLQKMFGKMMPRGPKKLGLSKMNFGGVGSNLMKKMMKEHNVTTLPELIELAQDLDVKMVACTMSMDVMGLQKEELIDGLEFAGVAAYLAEAEDSNINLFI
ncbi:DsrE/DsrF/DrsH-like family protein [Bacillus shivajii]|nr:DsrE/DsrF/DrsH-like family protein [Bacillus shivajii]UCZ53553.1 DsrE/DsrF/DrsH-like family protein [Bacillus shivajii]